MMKRRLICCGAMLLMALSVFAKAMSPKDSAKHIQRFLADGGYNCGVETIRSGGNGDAWDFIITLHNSSGKDIGQFLVAVAGVIARTTRVTTWPSGSVFAHTGDDGDGEVMTARTADCRKCYSNYAKGKNRSQCYADVWRGGGGRQGVSEPDNADLHEGREVSFWPGMRAYHQLPVRWEKLAPGFERAVLKYKGRTLSPKPGAGLVPRRVELVAFRIDPARHPIRVITARGLYGTKKARLGDVHKRMGAVLTINGGYFTHDGDPQGMSISDGKVRSKYTEDGGSGALAVYGPIVRIGWSINAALSDPMPDQALQNGPLLIEPGRKFGMMTVREKYFPRTVVAVDKRGYFLVAVTRKLYGEEDNRGGLNLFETAALLYNSVELGGLEAEAALNLDGGTSTGMALSIGGRMDSVRVGIGLPNFICVMPVAGQ